jgi:enamine deaminase RidA (YjgF/YER057c/UK114 family)
MRVRPGSRAYAGLSRTREDHGPGGLKKVVIDQQNARVTSILRVVVHSHPKTVGCLKTAQRMRLVKKKAYAAKYPVKVQFSRSVVVGNYVFVSGCSGQTLETFHASSNNLREQTEVAMDKVKGAIEEAGGSLEGIAKMVVYITRPQDSLIVEDAIDDYFQRHAPELAEEPPAQTLACIPGLHEPDLLVEI